MLKKFLSALFCMVLSIAAPLLSQEGDGAQPAPQGGDFSSNPHPKKLPANVILMKGAVPAASDSTTPVPESGTIKERIYGNRYFGISYPLPPGFAEKYLGPPPSDSAYYILAQIEPSKEFEAAGAGAILVSAQDLFFSLTSASDAAELIRFKKARLSTDYKVERQPTEVKIAGHSFVRMDFMSPVAGLHWYTLATQIRCHEVEFMLTSRDPELLEKLIQNMEKMALPDEAGPAAGRGGGNVPVCIKDYATSGNVLQRVDPVLTDRKFNPIPVRIIIDKFGKVKHVHVISAFAGQAKVITDALLQWEFRPYRRNGEAMEVETGMMFGASHPQRKPQANTASVD